MKEDALFVIPSGSFYSEYHGHTVSHLNLLHSHLRASHDTLIFLAGDSSLDNKFWFNTTAPAENSYETILQPPKSKRDIAYCLNRAIVLRNMHTKYAAINCAIEESSLTSRGCGLLDQDIFIQQHLSSRDILIVSVGGNDVALTITPCTALHLLALIASPISCIEKSCGTSLPCDDPCCGCLCGAASACLAFPYGLGYFIHLFRTRVEAYIRRLTSHHLPRLIYVCMIYFIDETSSDSWAERILSLMGYNSNPRKLQLIIEKLFVLATSQIRIPNTTVIPIPLFEVLDGKTTTDYCQRVEPSPQGGQKMANYLFDKIVQHDAMHDNIREYYK